MLPYHHYPLTFHFESLIYRLSTGNWAANICCICSACGLWHIIFNHSNAAKHSTSTNHCNRGMPSMQGMYFIGFTQIRLNKIIWPGTTRYVAFISLSLPFQVGALEEHMTLLGILCGIFFFPLGLICCLTLTERKCTNCGATFNS